MATVSSILFLTTVLAASASALQVTPNSPCASVCLDSKDLDSSDPDSSNTFSSDIACDDAEIRSTARGRKFQKCMTCLERSDFGDDQENDQTWFLYNMRFSFNYCVFGFPDGTGMESNPCLTSTACGGLQNALTEDELDPLKSSPSKHSYCDADDGAMLSETYGRCLDCFRIGNDRRYLTNFLIALETGCQQRPGPGQLVSLNDTVFSTTHVQAVDPFGSDSDSDDNAPLAVPAIVGIVAGAVVVVLLAVIGGYIRYRKRKSWLKEGPIERRLRRHSSLSFRCQTHLTPKTPNFPIDQEEVAKALENEKPWAHPAEPPNSHPPASPEMGSWHPASSPMIPSASQIPYQEQQYHPSLSVATSHLPGSPPKVHSPRQKHSPADDYHKTPTSTTSAFSTTPLLLPPLQPYVPADYAAPNSAVTPSPRTNPAIPSQPLPTFSPCSTSPVPSQGGNWPLPDDVQDYSPVVVVVEQQQQQQRQQGRVIDVLLGVEAAPVPVAAPSQQRRGLGLGLAVAVSSSSSSSLRGGSPIESRTLQTSFPPPPRAGWRR
ncbi:hypothetical protein SODALDRAFT_398644 [Sodiomyces alkalinus F11]|uniref:LPXTG-domain-containing protein n=1 Tax=Sodiomyces alkalinus (strain CBS 110278 / VKM F-3762 / F11) TaxID=1314773 RepID=A0A3N2PXE1_SODAK|nr:hypothetical protein SODALDRAFT_398644 [Sodiomyces alkalinus F11]ROT39203.1 hypothetical protein SODALDRAFT_398644 [Sodiomyces alkalinus F11]